MKKYRVGFLAFTLTSVVALASANAADMYRGPEPVMGGGYKDAPVYTSWAGFYVGVNGGYGWNATHSDDLVDPSGGFGGGQIGYNFQRGNIVFGIEADFQGAGISDSKSFFGGLISAKSELDWFGTVRGRVGYAFDGALIYGTGGLAYGSVKNGGCVVIFCGSTTETQTGWVAGGGVEYKIAPAWSAKAEYQFLSLDASDPNGAGPLGQGSGDRSEVHTFRVGVNYFVGRGYEPLK